MRQNEVLPLERRRARCRSGLQVLGNRAGRSFLARSQSRGEKKVREGEHMREHNIRGTQQEDKGTGHTP